MCPKVDFVSVVIYHGEASQKLESVFTKILAINGQKINKQKFFTLLQQREGISERKKN